MARNKAGSHKLIVRLKVREIAERKKITRSRLARLADVQYNTINAIFSNDTRDISLSTLVKIANALKVPVTDLYELLPDEPETTP